MVIVKLKKGATSAATIARLREHLITGTSSLEHLRENLQASTIQLPPEVLARLDSIGGRDSVQSTTA